MVEGDVLREAVVAMRGHRKNLYQEWHDSIYVLRVLWRTWALENGHFEAEEHRTFARGGSRIATGLENNQWRWERGPRVPGEGRSPQKDVRRKGSVCFFLFLEHSLTMQPKLVRNSRAWTSTSRVLGLQSHVPHLTGKVPHMLEHLKGKRGSGAPDKEGNKADKEKMTMIISMITKNKEVVTVYKQLWVNSPLVV